MTIGLPLLHPANKTFETSVSRPIFDKKGQHFNGFHFRSQELKWLLASLKEVKAYGKVPINDVADQTRYADQIRRLYRCTTDWENNCKAEFKARGGLLHKLQNEIIQLGKTVGVNAVEGAFSVNMTRVDMNRLRPEDQQLEPGEDYNGKPVNRWHKTKDRANMVRGAADGGVAAAQTLTGNPGALGAIGGGLAGASTGGIGLFAVGIVFLVVKTAVAAHGYRRTKRRITNLKQVMDNRAQYTDPCTCRALDPDQLSPTNRQRWDKHLYILDEVLPYLLTQKRKRRFRKKLAMVPIVPVELTRAVVRTAWKKFKGTKGVQRQYMSYLLTEHFLTHDCDLAQDIVTALYSEEEMEWMKWQDFTTVHALLYRKFKSS